MVEWTAANDAELKKLYEKRLSIAFIATWMRREGSDVRQRLQALGLAKARGAAAAAVATEGEGESEGEEDDFPARRGKHKGHLLTDEAIHALYKKAGRNYAGPISAK
jgi:hypothetical protein